MLLVYGFIHLLGRGRTILAKLILSSIPLLAVALVVFGVFSYRAYSAAITQSFQKQVEDEGNLLTALFGTESFDEIEYPYDYTGEAYGYLAPADVPPGRSIPPPPTMSTSSSISAWTLKTPASTPSTSGWTPARGSSTCRRPIPAGRSPASWTTKTGGVSSVSRRWAAPPGPRSTCSRRAF